MPKFKQRTCRGAAKRFRITKNGKIKRDCPHTNHILTKKSSKRKRQLRQGAITHAVSVNHIRKLLPGYF